MIGFLASSKAGHDKDKVYVVIKEDKEYVWLADGKTKTIAQPKKKRKKHIQLIKYFFSEDVKTLLEQGGLVSDLEITMVLKKYRKHQMSDTGGN